MSALPIFPGRHQPSIVGADELNCRVRDGNGCTLTVINTNSVCAQHLPRTILKGTLSFRQELVPSELNKENNHKLNLRGEWSSATRTTKNVFRLHRIRLT